MPVLWAKDENNYQLEEMCYYYISCISIVKKGGMPVAMKNKQMLISTSFMSAQTAMRGLLKHLLTLITSFICCFILSGNVWGKDYVYECGEPSDYSCGSMSGGGNCALSLEGSPHTPLIYENIANMKNPELRVSMKLCYKSKPFCSDPDAQWGWGGKTPSMSKYEVPQLEKPSDSEYKDGGWTRKKDSLWGQLNPSLKKLKPTDEHGAKLDIKLYATQYWYDCDSYYGYKKFTRTLISRDFSCGKIAAPSCVLCTKWKGNQCALYDNTYCFDGRKADTDFYGNNYCRVAELYPNLQAKEDGYCGYQHPKRDVWKAEPYTTIIDANNSQLPADGLYIFVYHKGNYFVIRRSDRPGQDDRGFCSDGDEKYLWKKADGSNQNPDTCTKPGEEKPFELNAKFVRHSQLAGDPGGSEKYVIYAGVLEIYNGRVIWMSNRSGHYRPDTIKLRFAMEALKKLANIQYPIQHRSSDGKSCYKQPCTKESCEKIKCDDPCESLPQN